MHLELPIVERALQRNGGVEAPIAVDEARDVLVAELRHVLLGVVSELS